MQIEVGSFVCGVFLPGTRKGNDRKEGVTGTGFKANIKALAESKGKGIAMVCLALLEVSHNFIHLYSRIILMAFLVVDIKSNNC